MNRYAQVLTASALAYTAQTSAAAKWARGTTANRRKRHNQRARNEDIQMTLSVQGVGIPDSKLAREITELVRDTASPLLFHHSSRVYYFGALAGKRRALSFDPELLYAGAMFHDMGLTPKHSSAEERFEVDGANTARNFLRSHRISQADIDTVWTAIALHTTPGIPQHMHPVVALVTAGVEMDVLGLTYPAQRSLQGRHHSGLLRWHQA
jgi:hypothetical protein